MGTNNLARENVIGCINTPKCTLWAMLCHYVMETVGLLAHNFLFWGGASPHPRSLPSSLHLILLVYHPPSCDEELLQCTNTACQPSLQLALPLQWLISESSSGTSKHTLMGTWLTIAPTCSCKASNVALLLYVSYTVVFIVCRDRPDDCYSAFSMAPSKLHSSENGQCTSQHTW